MKIRYYKNFFYLLIIFFNNFLAIPFLIVDILKKRNVAINFGVLFFVFGYFYRPLNEKTDLFRYYELFNQNKVIREALFNYQKDIYAEYMINFLIKNNLPKYFLAAISAFITYYFLFKTLELIITRIKLKGVYRVICYIITYLSFSIIGYTGIRFYPAMSLMAYSIIATYKLRKKVYILLALLATMIHSSMVVPLVLLVLIELKFLYRVNIKIMKLFILISSVLGKLISVRLLSEIATIINQNINLIKISESYISGRWGIEFISHYNIIGKIVKYYFPFWTFIIIFLLYGIFLLEKNKIDYFIAYIIMFCFMLQNFQTIFFRYSRLTILLIITLTIYKIFNGKKYKMIGNIIVLIFLLWGVLNLMIDLKDYHLDIYYSYIKVFKISLFGIFKDVLFNMEGRCNYLL